MIDLTVALLPDDIHFINQCIRYNPPNCINHNPGYIILYSIGAIFCQTSYIPAECLQ